jgi:hypothetical protein
MSPALLAASSVTEAHFFLLVQACAQCQQGRLEAAAAHTESEHIDAIVRFDCVCCSCQASSQLRFKMDAARAMPTDPPVVNPASTPSRLIDVAQWIALFTTLVGAANDEPDRQSARRLGYEAALCLEEALKFYEAENDLPPDSAFFHDDRKHLARTQPAQFSRGRLLDLRSKLPTMGAMSRTLKGPKQKRWWQRWR